MHEISNNLILKSTFCNYSARRSKPDVSPCTMETVCSASTRSHKLQLLRNPRVTSDRALMHSGISVIARRSHERRVSPLPLRRQWSSVRRSAETLLPRSERSYRFPSPHRVILILLQHSDGPRVLWDPSFSSLSIPQAPRFLPRAIRWYSVSPCAPITRRNAHLVRDGGPIMVSDHSKLLSTRGSSSKP